MTLKNIIFDLGGVILNIDYHKTIQAFQELGFIDFVEFYTQAVQSNLFNQLETGKITASDFRDSLRNIAKKQWGDSQIDTAWNAMLLDIPSEKLAFLEHVKTRYNIVLLSNTNEIHAQAFEQYVEETYDLKAFKALFKQYNYSHKIGLRKPDSACFQYVLNSNQFSAAETLFIDDSSQHIQSAKALGIQTYHLSSNHSFDTIIPLLA